MDEWFASVVKGMMKPLGWNECKFEENFPEKDRKVRDTVSKASTLVSVEEEDDADENDLRNLDEEEVLGRSVRAARWKHQVDRRRVFDGTMLEAAWVRDRTDLVMAWFITTTMTQLTFRTNLKELGRALPDLTSKQLAANEDMVDRGNL